MIATVKLGKIVKNTSQEILNDYFLNQSIKLKCLQTNNEISAKKVYRRNI